MKLFVCQYKVGGPRWAAVIDTELSKMHTAVQSVVDLHGCEQEQVMCSWVGSKKVFWVDVTQGPLAQR